MVFGPSMVSHIGTFGAHFHVSSMFFFPGVKRPSSFTNVAPRTCGAGNFVEDNRTIVESLYLFNF